MPPAISVQLLPHDPHWAEMADVEMRALSDAIGSTLVAIHHIGSTAIPGIRAKPILDLLPVVKSLAIVDHRKSELAALGYDSWGELGLPGRRYYTKVDPVTGARIVQVHCYEKGSQEISRHIAFRDFLRGRPDVAAEYERVKVACQAAHPDNSHAYGDCKQTWIDAVEKDAMASFGASKF